MGDLGLAYQAFKVAVSVDPTHGEALNNIAVLEMRRQKFDLARSCLNTSMDVGPQLFEPLYNTGYSRHLICIANHMILEKNLKVSSDLLTSKCFSVMFYTITSIDVVSNG